MNTQVNHRIARSEIFGASTNYRNDVLAEIKILNFSCFFCVKGVEQFDHTVRARRLRGLGKGNNLRINSPNRTGSIWEEVLNKKIEKRTDQPEIDDLLERNQSHTSFCIAWTFETHFKRLILNFKCVFCNYLFW